MYLALWMPFIRFGPVIFFLPKADNQKKGWSSFYISCLTTAFQRDGCLLVLSSFYLQCHVLLSVKQLRIVLEPGHPWGFS